MINMYMQLCKVQKNTLYKNIRKHAMHVPVPVPPYLPNLTQLTFEAELEKAWGRERERERERWKRGRKNNQNITQRLLTLRL